ncbi:unnamed protein product [Caenorhabditis auriculariae]|uniref:CHK kinase-like domain-containing protein n=1 Tax=Caenorhabditis auriculariae TaxID=2777116 RepID=A0A8S1HD50_9PELO|nr:unnamed protein product [Caenorhabditis auriculariae]
MSLHIPAGGILGTHVTWRDVEEELQTTLNTSSHFGPDKSVTNIGDMKGFMSRICLVQPDWQGEDVEKLPQKFVVKISSQLAFVEMEEKFKAMGGEFISSEKLEGLVEICKQAHNCEVATYKLLKRENNPHIPITKIYASRGYSESNKLKGFLVSELLEDLYSVPAYETISAKDILQPLRAIAAFTSLGEKLPEEEFDHVDRSDFAAKFIEAAFDDTAVRSTKNLLLQSVSEEYKEKTEKLNNLMDFYFKPEYYNKLQFIPEHLGYKKDKSLKLRAVIDWQTVSFSNPGQDMCRLMIACMKGKERRENWEKLLEQFYAWFEEDMQDRPMPYTLEQLKKSYRMYFPIAAFFVLPMIGPMLQMAQGDMDEDIKAVIKEAAMEKLYCLIEDVLEMHERNLKEFPDFHDV